MASLDVEQCLHTCEASCNVSTSHCPTYSAATCATQAALPQATPSMHNSCLASDQNNILIHEPLKALVPGNWDSQPTMKCQPGSNADVAIAGQLLSSFSTDASCSHRGSEPESYGFELSDGDSEEASVLSDACVERLEQLEKFGQLGQLSQQPTSCTMLLKKQCKVATAVTEEQAGNSTSLIQATAPSWHACTRMHSPDSGPEDGQQAACHSDKLLNATSAALATVKLPSSATATAAMVDLRATNLGATIFPPQHEVSPQACTASVKAPSAAVLLSPTCHTGLLLSKPQNPQYPQLTGKTILLVLTGSAGRRSLLQSIAKTGVRIICYNHAPNWAADYIHPDDWVLGPRSSTTQALDAVHAFMRKQPVTFTLDGVLCYDEFGLQLASYLADALHVPTIPSSVIDIIRNKHLFRLHCAQAGIAGPKFLHVPGEVTSKTGQQLAQQGLTFPLVAKPAKGAGSYHACKVHSLEELREVVDRFHADVSQSLDVWGLEELGEAGGMLLEQFVAGHEVDVDCIVQDGEVLFASISDNHPTVGTSFVERGGRCPSGLPLAAQQALLQLTRQVVQAFGTSLRGCFHFEALWTPQGAVPIELNARIGGAETFLDVLIVWGVNLGQEALKLCLGMPLQPQDYPTGPRVHVHSVNFAAPEPWPGGAGVLEHTTVAEHVVADPALVGLELFYKPGDVVKLPPDGFSYLGWMVAAGRDGHQAEQSLQRLVKGVQFVLRKP